VAWSPRERLDSTFLEIGLCYDAAAMTEPLATLDQATLKERIKSLLVDRLQLDMSSEEIGDDDPLFGEGLGLDSIDALELVLGVEQEFGVKIEDEEIGQEALSSVQALAGFVASKQNCG